MDRNINAAVIGLGLLGTSLALALKKSSAFTVSAWARRESTRLWAKEHNVADNICDNLPELLKDADIAVLCLPLESAIEMLPLCRQYLPAHAVVTDIASVKQDICRAAANFTGLRFIGSHPMAGTEKSGCEAAFPELYLNADIFIVPPENADEEYIRRRYQTD